MIDNTLYEKVFKLSDRLWDNPEIHLQEKLASKLLSDFLEEEGFRIEHGIYGFPTAFRAEYGVGEPTIGYLGEFDALPRLSQESKCSIKKPIVNEGPGHGCGHNLLGTACILAAVLSKRKLENEKLRGKIVFYGCPAEEGISAKAWMVKAGAFRDLDIALTWHPGNANMVMPCWALASVQKQYIFTGKSSHAAQAPGDGRNALNAVELMNIGTQFYREELPKNATFHYAITDGGGEAVNVVQDHAECVYQVRGDTIQDVNLIVDRIDKIAKAAAVMTETECEIRFIKGCSNLLENSRLNELLYDVYSKLGVLEVDDEDISFAKEIRQTFTDHEKKMDMLYLQECFTGGKELSEKLRDSPIIDSLYPRNIKKHGKTASSDTGDVSQIVPLAHIQAACFAQGTKLHSWQLVAQGKCNLAHKAIAKVGEVLSVAGLELIKSPLIVQEIKNEFNQRREESEYLASIPEDEEFPYSVDKNI